MFKRGDNKPVDERNALDSMQTLPKGKNATESATSENSAIPSKVVPLYREAERRKQDHERSLDVFKKYQENILRSGNMISQLAKGMEAGDDIHSLYLKAVEAIALMTNDNAIRESAKRYMRTLYGIGSQRERPLQRELEAVNKTLFYLEESLLWETDEAEIERIQKAITTHTRRADALEAEIEKGRA